MFVIPAEETEYIKSERLAQIATVSPEKMQPDIVSVDFDLIEQNFYIGGKSQLNGI